MNDVVALFQCVVNVRENKWDIDFSEILPLVPFSIMSSLLKGEKNPPYTQFKYKGNRKTVFFLRASHLALTLEFHFNTSSPIIRSKLDIPGFIGNCRVCCLWLTHRVIMCWILPPDMPVKSLDCSNSPEFTYVTHLALSRENITDSPRWYGIWLTYRYITS